MLTAQAICCLWSRPVGWLHGALMDKSVMMYLGSTLFSRRYDSSNPSFVVHLTVTCAALTEREDSNDSQPVRFLAVSPMYPVLFLYGERTAPSVLLSQRL